MRDHAVVRSRWLRGRRGAPAPDDPPIPVGTSLEDAAHGAVVGFWDRDAFEGASEVVESIEVVSVGDPAEPGIQMTWRQHGNPFGLLIPISRLALQSGDLSGAPFYLRLAVDEPQEPDPNGRRRWFSDLPSGPY